MYYNGKIINKPCGNLIKSGDKMIDNPDDKKERKVVTTFMVLP